MANETPYLQFAGRRGGLSEQDIQAQGRSSVYVAGGVEPNREPAGETDAAAMPVADYPALQPGYPPPIPAKRRLSKKSIAVLCSAAGLVLILSVIGISAALTGGKEKAPPESQNAGITAGAPIGTEPSESTPAPTETPEISEAPAAIALKDGEFLYSGHLDCAQAGDLQLSFVLSADLSYIHDINIEITDLSASVQSGYQTTTVNVSSLTETYSGEYPVSFEYGGYDIPVGRGFIRGLYFYEGFAFVELDYVYYSAGFGSDGDIEIPLDTVYGALTTANVPNPAAAGMDEDMSSAESEPFPTQTVFAYDKLKNWNTELAGGVYGFEPADPRPRYYIVCANTVIDPKTGVESAGGYENNYTRHKPVSTDAVLRRSGELINGGLILTDDPDLATYALIITFAYDHTGTFTFSDDTSVVQYHGTTKAELYNMTTGERIYTNDLNTYATYANESVYTAMLDNAKGKQFYAQSHTVSASDFDDYWDFIED